MQIDQVGRALAMEANDMKQMMFGVCTQWDKKGSFGFIEPDDDSPLKRIFCHVTALKDGSKTLASGQAVRFTADYNEWRGKWECKSCWRVGTWRHDAGEKRDCVPWHEKREVCAGPGDGAQLEGTATWVAPRGNYGFLEIDVAALTNDDLASLWIGDEGKESTLRTMAHISNYVGLAEKPVTLARGDVVCFTLGHCWHKTKEKLQRACPSWFFQREYNEVKQEATGKAIEDAKGTKGVATATGVATSSVEATGATEQLLLVLERRQKRRREWLEEPEFVDTRVPKTPEEPEAVVDSVPKTPEEPEAVESGQRREPKRRRRRPEAVDKSRGKTPEQPRGRPRRRERPKEPKRRRERPKEPKRRRERPEEPEAVDGGKGGQRREPKRPRQRPEVVDSSKGRSQSGGESAQRSQEPSPRAEAGRRRSQEPSPRTEARRRKRSRDRLAIAIGNAVLAGLNEEDAIGNAVLAGLNEEDAASPMSPGVASPPPPAMTPPPLQLHQWKRPANQPDECRQCQTKVSYSAKRCQNSCSRSSSGWVCQSWLCKRCWANASPNGPHLAWLCTLCSGFQAHLDVFNSRPLA